MAGRLVLEYDGGGFHGWSRQPGLRTVQGVVEEALGRALGRRAAVTVAGRTDAGVHAVGQVASHPGPPARASHLNALLPDDVRVVSSEATDDDFDARRDARSRVYRYRVLNRAAQSPFERGRALHTSRNLNPDALAACARELMGTHDFRAFTPTKTDHVRFDRDVIWADWWAPTPQLFEFWIEADTFMRHMVRTLVGTMLEVGADRRSHANFVRLLTGRPRPEAAETAPACGLYLMAVCYREQPAWTACVSADR